jgi:transcriptional regulator with XRE-family HTH domain
MTRQHLGARIRAGRERARLTQQELANQVGITRVYVAKLEGGDRDSPSLPVLERIAKALGVKLVDLLK